MVRTRAARPALVTTRLERRSSHRSIAFSARRVGGRAQGVEPGQLLGEARLHVVQQRNAVAAGEQRGREGGLLDRVDAAVARGVDEPRRSAHIERHVEDDLPEGQADRHALEPEGVGRPEDAQARNGDVRPDREGQEVNGTPELAQRLEDLADGDRGSPVLVKRLRSHDQNAATGDFRHAVIDRGRLRPPAAKRRRVPRACCRGSGAHRCGSLHTPEPPKCILLLRLQATTADQARSSRPTVRTQYRAATAEISVIHTVLGKQDSCLPGAPWRRPRGWNVVSDRRGGAEVGQDASLAARPAGDADLAAVEDQEVGEQRPVVLREERHQVLLDLHRIVMPRQPEQIG